ncbi:MAG TPA: hypothetical protein VHD83_03560 [Puia sp.]|nr:hypothetical protein [Puia sp.]
MKSLSHRKALLPAGDPATGFLHTMYFDLDFNYIGGLEEQVNIAPDAPDNWESESCKLIPHVRYEYTRVSKKKLEASRPSQTRINQAKEKLKYFVVVGKNKGLGLRIVKDSIVTNLQPNLKAVSEITLYFLEESYGSLDSDVIAAERKMRDIPSHLKEAGKGASKKSGSTSNKRRAK